jgi:protein-disulfide isomerase-like protein with CxxC motif
LNSIGGVNTHGTQPIGDHGRRLLMHIWRDVQATTGQRFGFRLPSPASAAVFRRGREYQRQGIAAAHGGRLRRKAWGVAQNMAKETLRSQVAAEFAASRGYGTSALPSR